MLPKKYHKLSVATIVWLFIISLNALAAGFSFMVEPSGKDVGIPLSYLQYSPFKNYFIPGLLLFATIGLGCMLVAILGIKKYKYFPQLLFLQGCILLGWIIIQMLLIRDVYALHVVCGASALAWMYIALLFLKENKKGLSVSSNSGMGSIG